MAIPSAIAKQRKRIEAREQATALEPKVLDISEAPPQVEVPQTASAPERQPATENYVETLADLKEQLTEASTPDEVAQVRQEIAKLKDGYSSMLGRAQAEAKRASAAEARLQLQDDAMRSLEARAAAAEQARDEFSGKENERTRKERLAGLDDAEDMSEEELNQFDPKDIKLIRALNKRQTVPVMKTLLTELDELKAQVARLLSVDQTVADISKSHQAIAAQAAETIERDFFTKSLTPHFPEWQKWTQTPDWETFLATSENDDPNVKKGHVLHHYRKSKFVPGIVALFKEFEARQQLNNGNSLQSLATPAKTSAERTPTVKGKMKTSEYIKMRDGFMRSKSVSRTDWEKYKAAFASAQQEKRVDDDAGIL